MADEVTVNKLGPEMKTVLLVEWLVRDGDVVEAGQPIATLETDKITTDIAATATGTIDVIATAGAEYAVGERLATIASQSETDASPRQQDAHTDPGETGRPSSPDGAPASESGASGASSTPQSDHLDPVRGPAATRAPRQARTRGAGEHGRPRASPVARRMATALGVDLDALAAAADGRPIRKRHVEEAAAHQGAGATARDAPIAAAPYDEARRAAEPDGATESTDDTPTDGGAMLSPMRRRIASRMHASLQETAQITDVREHDVTDLVELRREANRWATALGLGLSFTDLFARAAALALRDVPDLNVSLVDDRLVQHRSINLGVAVALPDGLIVPVLHDADALSLAEMHARLSRLIESARLGELALADLTGGTFTITNIGSYGSHVATPILVQGQVGILATGAFIRRPVVRGEDIVAGTVMYTSLTVDHRVVDGETAGRFQTALGQLLTDPQRLL